MPGSGQCPATASSCDTVTSASGRALVIGLNAGGLVTSVTDPMGRTWAYGYTGGDLTSVTDPLGGKTTYAFGEGVTGNPLLANDLLTVTSPNVWVPTTSFTSCDQAVFVDHAAGTRVSSGSVLLKFFRFGERLQRCGGVPQDQDLGGLPSLLTLRQPRPGGCRCDLEEDEPQAHDW